MPKPDPQTRLADAAFRLLAESSWADLTLVSVARAAKIPAAELLEVAPSKPALLGVMLRRLSGELARRYRPDRESQSARDRTFDVCMTWFGLQKPRKKAMRALTNGLSRDPPTLLGARREFVAAAEWILALGEADAGPALQIRAAILAGMIARAMPVWLADDDEMGKTMAQLDRDLRRAENLLWPRGATKKKRRPTSRKR
jgi:AcrR family transcriptional regulator